MALGENIRKRREELRLSQGYVAEQLGVSRQAVSKWEAGQSEPTAGNLVQLAEVFGISLSELVEPQRDSGQQSPSGEERAGKKPNLILRANLIRIAITAQAAFFFTCTSMIYQFQHADLSEKNLYRGAVIFSLVMLTLSSIWMAANHRYEADKNQRRKNTRIELVYCCIQLLAGLLTIRFGMGLAGRGDHDRGRQCLSSVHQPQVHGPQADEMREKTVLSRNRGEMKKVLDIPVGSWYTVLVNQVER